MNKLTQVLNSKKLERLKRWCLMKQVSGFQGRPNKDPDTCYSFWVGATLKLLNSYHLMNEEENVDFVLSTEDDEVGGLSKFPQNSSGIYDDHSDSCPSLLFPKHLSFFHFIFSSSLKFPFPSFLLCIRIFLFPFFDR